MVIICVGLMLAGCWDYRELENRAIIVGLGIDELPPVRNQGAEMRMYQIIVQIVEPANEEGGSNMGASPGSTGMHRRGYTNFIIESPSIAECVERIITRSDRMPNLAHLQLIALGENLVKKGIDELYDFFTRFPQMRRHTEIVVFHGSIPEFFSIPSLSEPTPALHIAEMADSVQKTNVMLESNLGEVSRSIRAKRPYLLLHGYLDKQKEIVMNKAVVFEGYKMKGTLTRQQLQELSILHGEIERGLLDMSCDGGKKIGTQVLSGKTKVKPSFRNGKPHITFQVEMDMELVEYQCLGATLDKPEQIRKLENKFAADMQKRLTDTARELQKKYQADVFRLTTRLKNVPEMYKMIKDRPKEFFQQVTMDVQVDFRIQNLGNTLETPPHL
jgi:Ger(x)C family germination protein